MSCGWFVVELFWGYEISSFNDIVDGCDLMCVEKFGDFKIG